MELKPLLEALEDDLQKKFFYHYPRQKAITLLRIRIDWAASLGAHPSEVDAGVDCYAIGQYAACVFHMMRVAEIGYAPSPASGKSLSQNIRSNGQNGRTSSIRLTPGRKWRLPECLAEPRETRP
jgi:hypothetical protein